jgi:hypothetical protein
MIGRTRCHLANSSSVGIRPVVLSGFGAAWVVRTPTRVPHRRSSSMPVVPFAWQIRTQDGRASRTRTGVAQGNESTTTPWAFDARA